MPSTSTGTIGAIAGKELRTFLGNPTGYVFLTLFIVASAAAAFLTDTFFGRNLADLATLNKWMPAILMFFVPAITMNLWADERRSGTDELLLTLPVRDTEVVLGKFFGALGVYTVGLLFSLANVLVLAYLGEPDVGLMFATYLGYWLMGALFVAVGMMGSMFTGNTTVAFILGALGCAALVFAGQAPWSSGLIGVVMVGALIALAWNVIVGSGKGAGQAAAIGVGVLIGLTLWLALPLKLIDMARGLAGTESDLAASLKDVGVWFTDTFAAIGAPSHFESFGEGLVRLGDMAYFIGGAAVALYLCGILISRRHW
jgi:ABC-type transport system involved in multi-copper enzyme maturation permease subunit